jgi:hypothetical protein
VQEIASPTPTPSRRRREKLALPRPAFVLVPAAAALVLAVGAAGVIGLAGSDGGPGVVFQKTGSSVETPGPLPPQGLPPTPGSVGRADAGKSTTASPPTSSAHGEATTLVPLVPSTPISPTPGRAQQIDATLKVKVADSNHVSQAAQDALDLTHSLGGHVESASVTTGDQAQATLRLRIPVDKSEEAVTRLSALGAIVSQQVSIQDLQEQLDAVVRRARSVRTQIVEITARLESHELTPEQRATLELRRRNLRAELRVLRRDIRSTHAVATFATVEVGIVTPDSLGVVPTASRLDRSLDKAVEVLVWEAIVGLVVLLVAAPLALLVLAILLARRLYRRHEEDRLLATS